MANRRKKLGRGMSQLVDGSLRSIIDSGERTPARDQPPRDPAPRPAPGDEERPAAAAPRPAPRAGLPKKDPTVDGSGRAPAPPPSDRRIHVVGIASGKGGTGKSFLTSNLAVLLAGARRVTILDADLGLANIHILYNLLPEFNASHVITGEKSLEEILLEGPRGVRVIPGGSGIPELATLSDMMFGSLADGIASLETSTDLMLIDAPSGIDRQSLLFLLACDQVLVVTTDDITAMTDAYALIKTVLIRRPEANVVVVVNQARTHAEGMETFQRIAHVSRRFLGRDLALGGIIPFDDLAERSVSERVPVVLSHPEAPSVRAMASLAGRVATFHQRSRPAARPFIVRLKDLLAAAPAEGG